MPTRRRHGFLMRIEDFDVTLDTPQEGVDRGRSDLMVAHSREDFSAFS
jgi:hypothetical protein